MKNNYYKILEHLELFNEKEDKYIKKLKENFFKNDYSFDIEKSIKYENNKFYSKRINLWFKNAKEHKKVIKEIINYINLFYPTKLEELKKFFKIIDSKSIRIIVLGIDTRKNEKTRLKIWTINKKNKTELNKIINQIFPKKKITIINNELLIGIDISKTKINYKIYPIYFEKDLKLIEKIPIKFKKNIERVHIAYTEKNNNKVLHIIPKKINQLIQEINLSALNTTYQKIKKYKDKKIIISLDLKEMKNNKITKFNIYY